MVPFTEQRFVPKHGFQVAFWFASSAHRTFPRISPESLQDCPSQHLPGAQQPFEVTVMLDLQERGVRDVLQSYAFVQAVPSPNLQSRSLSVQVGL